MSEAEEGDGYTTPPAPQDMGFKSNVVPAPSPTGDSIGDPTERDSRLNSKTRFKKSEVALWQARKCLRCLWVIRSL